MKAGALLGRSVCLSAWVLTSIITAVREEIIIKMQEELSSVLNAFYTATSERNARIWKVRRSKGL